MGEFVVGLIVGFVVALLVGFIAGRLQGIGEGRFRERRAAAQRAERRAVVASADSMAEFTAPRGAPPLR